MLSNNSSDKILCPHSMEPDPGLSRQQQHKQVALREAITVNNNKTKESKRRKKLPVTSVLGVDNPQLIKLQGTNKTATTAADTTMKK